MKEFTLKEVLEQLKKKPIIFDAYAKEIDLVELPNIPSDKEMLHILSKHAKLIYNATLRIGPYIYVVDLYKVNNSPNEIKYVIMLTGYTGYMSTYMRAEGYETFNKAKERTREIVEAIRDTAIDAEREFRIPIDRARFDEALKELRELSENDEERSNKRGVAVV